MSAVDLEATVLSDLDFTSTLPCEHSQHDTLHRPDGPARWIVIRPPAGMRCCGAPRADYLICDTGRDRFLRDGSARCITCGRMVPLRWSIVAFRPIGDDQ